MKKIALPLALLLLTALCFNVAANEAADRKKLKAVSADILKLQQSLKNVSGQRDSLAVELQKTETERARIQLGINKLEPQLKRLNQDLQQLNKQQVGLQRDRRQQQHLILTQVNAAFRLGREEPVKLLLNQEDPERLTRTLKYYDYFLQARAKKLNTYVETLHSLAKVELSINDKTTQLKDHRDQLHNEQQQLLKRQQQRHQVMAKLDGQINTDHRRLQKLQNERNRLETVLQALKQAIADIDMPAPSQPFAKQRGKMRWPIKGKLSHRFGSQRNAEMKWDGWLLNANEGVAVKAIHHGRVVFSDYLRGYGMLIIIDHGDSYMSLYAHNQVLLKETGDWVTADESVAKVGNSGGRIEHALYFEIRHNGKPTNPKHWLASR